MCHALAKVAVLDFKGTEVQRYRGEQGHEGGTSSERMGDLVDIQTEVQRQSTEDLYTVTFGCRYGEACGKVRRACG